MSATSESILQEIRDIESTLTGDISEQDRSQAEKRLSELRKRFVNATTALNEGKGVLKG